MLRRLKTEVEKLLPDKLEIKVYCLLSKTQTFWYKGLLLKDVTKLANMEDPAQTLGTTQHTLLRSLSCSSTSAVTIPPRRTRARRCWRAWSRRRGSCWCWACCCSPFSRRGIGWDLLQIYHDA